MAARTLAQLKARWEKLTRRMWREERAMLAGQITRSEQLTLDTQRQASQRALEIEAQRQAAIAAEFTAAKQEFAGLVEQAVR